MSSSKNSDRSHNQQGASSSQKNDNLEVMEFSTGEGKIRLNKKNMKIYKNQTKYDLALADKTDWHMVVIHHEGKYKKAEILERIFAVADNVECYIIGYRQCSREDYFFVRLCRQFLSKLFFQCLKLKMRDGPFLYLTVKLCVAEYSHDQIHHLTLIEKAFTERFNRYEVCEETTKVLNLDHFAQLPEFAELIFSLSNKAAFIFLCSLLTKHCDIFQTVNGIRLSNNELTDLTPLATIPAIDIDMIDLRNNKISDVDHLKFLQKMNLTELFIANNPITKNDEFMTKVDFFLPNIVKVDGKYTRNVLPSLIHLGSGASTIEVIFQGDVIQSNDQLAPSQFRKYKTSDMWHQVLINHNGKYAKNELLFAIFNSLMSHELYPCYYQTGEKRDSFFIRNCFEQMEVLLKNEKLKIQMPFSNDRITLTYRMNVANFKREQIDAAICIQNAIESSFNLTDKVLNLERFSSKPELVHIELLLYVPQMLSNILIKGARSFLLNIETLILRDNGIESSKGMHPLTFMKGLKSIDLSKNKIDNFSDLERFPKISGLTAIKLYDNPLYHKYKSSPLEYIAAVKNIFRDIENLDGRFLSPDRCCAPQRNYLCSIDTYDLTEQFVHHYFSVYDSTTRASLHGLYSKNAIFSISCNFSGLTSRTTDSRIKLWQMKSRNIRRDSLSTVVKNIFNGPDEIKQLWKLLPQTKHDLKSFSIDVTYCSSMMVVLKVNGLFKELAPSLNEEDLVLAFSRTFVLKRVADGAGFLGYSNQFIIINEMLYLHRPSIFQSKNSFRLNENMETDGDEDRLTSEEKAGLVALFQELTCLVPLWCIRCLKQSSWNFRNAIDLFTHLCDENKVPDCAFNFEANSA